MNAVAIVGLAVVGFVGFFCLLMVFIGRVAGWGRLASAFPGGDPPAGRILSGRSVGIWPATNYGGVIQMSIGLDALWMQPVGPFRLGHPPIRLPWAKVVSIERSQMFPKGLKVTFDAADKRILALLPLDSESELANVNIDKKSLASL